MGTGGRLVTLRAAVDLTAGLAMTAAAATLIWMAAHGRIVAVRTQQGVTPALEEESAQNIEGDRLTMTIAGHTDVENTEAPVALIEFSDFECPFCGKYARETLPQIRKDFITTGKVAYVFMHFPLAELHRFAMEASQAAACAGRQRQFWAVHDLLFQDQKAITLAAVRPRIVGLGLDDMSFARCVSEIQPEIARDTAEGKRLGVTSTPTFLIGKLDRAGRVALLRRITGAYPYDMFKRALLEML